MGQSTMSSSSNMDDPMMIDPPSGVLSDHDDGAIEAPKKENNSSNQSATGDTQLSLSASTESKLENNGNAMEDDDPMVSTGDVGHDVLPSESCGKDRNSDADADADADADSSDTAASCTPSNEIEMVDSMEKGTSEAPQLKLEESQKQNCDLKDSLSKLDDTKKLEKDLKDSLYELEKIIATFVSGNGSPGEGTRGNDVVVQLKEVANNAHDEIKRYGYAIEMGAIVDKASSYPAALQSETREFLQDTGKKLWMTIRNHSSLFRDHLTRSLEDTPEEKNKDIATNKQRAVATGYIRAIAARLILINYIRTKDIDEPCLALDSSNALSKPSVSELEFGVRCFARSGRVLLAHGDDPNGSFNSLLLSIKCWEALATMAQSKQQGRTSHSEAGEKMLDEVFDAFLLMPDAASLLRKKSSNADTIRQLRLLKEFVETNCKGQNGLHAGLDTALVVKRYLPALAKTAYKHGKRFASNKENLKSRDALQIALETTETCLQYIGDSDIVGNGSHSSASVSPFFTQEHEMLVVSKECFYVLSYVLKCLDEKANAHKCLDQLETYINRQVELDERVFVSTMKACEGGKDVETVSDPIFALEGLDGDLADIKARAQTAKARATFTEAKERSNLAFSRIMLVHESSERLSEGDRALIDGRFGELAKLSVKLKGSDKNTTTNQEEFNPLKLVLEAARAIRGRQIQEMHKATIENNPYDVLLQIYSNNDSKIRVCLDHLKVMTASMVDKQISLNAELDKLCIQTAQGIVDKIVSEKARSNRSNSDLIPNYETGLDFLVKESQIRFAEALSVYRSHGSHKLCAQWADFLIKALLNFRESDGFSTILKLDLDETTSRAVSDIMAAKALALSNIPQSSRTSCVYAEALKVAREAWKLGQSLHTLAALFHCGVLSETHADGVSPGETLMELDNALATIAANSNRTSSVDLLNLFPALSTCCAENNANVLLLGIQERWLKKAIVVLDKNLSKILSADSDPSTPLFSILRAYLRNFELLDETTEPQCIGLIHCLKGVLRLIIRLRNKTTKPKKKTSSDSSTPFELVWDTATFNFTIGEQKDCVWVAEQLWNLGIVAASSFSADILSAAHDFALLAEEEVGISLTKDHLDVDKTTDSSTSDMNSYKTLLAHEKKISACDLCSEFSAQCMLVSVATEVDRSETQSDENEALNRKKRNLIRLHMARRELDGCERPNLQQEERQYVEGLVSWLELRCLILIGEDSLCSDELSTGNLLVRLSASSSKDISQLSASRSGERNHNQEDNSKLGQPLAATSVLSHVLVASFNAKLRHMFESAKILLQFVTKEMVGKEIFSVVTPDGVVHSLGELQRTLIRLGSKVTDSISTFSSIDSLVKKYSGTNGQQIDPLKCYSTEELDWFSVETYNRGLRLFNLGDSNNAEKLIAIALNLVPFCGKEVESFASDMRQTFAIIVKSKAGDNCISSESLMNLFNRT